LLWPGEALVDAFSTLAAPMQSKSNVADSEIQVLRDLRDTLLPALLSGEVTIKQAEKAVGEVA
jgi:type I restriction enzyme S subunit